MARGRPGTVRVCGVPVPAALWRPVLNYWEKTGFCAPQDACLLGFPHLAGQLWPPRFPSPPGPRSEGRPGTS